MLSRFYRWFWFHTEIWLAPENRRPYTFILRDFYHCHPILWTWGAFTAGYLFFDLELKNFALISLGLLLGHLFWGDRWVEGEQEEPTYIGG